MTRKHYTADEFAPEDETSPVEEAESTPAFDMPDVATPKSFKRPVPFPQTYYAFTDADLKKSKQDFRQQPLDVVVITETEDWGAVITRLARLLTVGKRIFVRSVASIWSQHFEDVGESRNGYWCYTTKRP